MKILILGGRGRFGSDLASVAHAKHDATALSSTQCDVNLIDSVRSAMLNHQPDVVVNCACSNFAGDAEADPWTSFAVDSVGAGMVAKEAAKIGATSVYISSDYVFSGDKGTSYDERDYPYPINVYGTSKLAGERLTAQANPKHIIARISTLFGGSPAVKRRNFVWDMAVKASQCQQSYVRNDLTVSPTYAWDAAQSLVKILESGQFGEFHLSNAGSVTYFGLAQHIYRLMKIEDGVKPCEPDPKDVRRPLNSSLSSVRMAQLGITPRPWTEAVEDYLRRSAFLASKEEWEAHIRCSR